MAGSASEERWLVLWAHIGATGDGSKVYALLAGLYSEPGRAYHTLVHIGHLLDQFEAVRHITASPDELEWALWFHDAIYDTRTKDSEERSAVLSSSIAIEALLPEAFFARAAKFIIGTKHQLSHVDPDVRLIADIDLSILGQSDEAFDEYECQVRSEYGWVPDDQFWKVRSEFLGIFLNRQHIYRTEFFREKYEAAARRNLARSIAGLSR